MKMLRQLSVVVVLLLLGSSGLRAAEDVRFSKSLGASDAAAIGVGKLSVDQVAVLDALVRRDLAQADRPAKTPRPGRFSERLTDNERRNSGIDQLAVAEVTELDRQVAQRTSLAPGAWLATSANSTTVVPSVKIRRGAEVHGSVELMVGAGSHGYSEYGGAMTVAVEDPSSGLTVAFSYAEIHSKGGYLYRNCRDGYWARPGDPRWW